MADVDPTIATPELGIPRPAQGAAFRPEALHHIIDALEANAVSRFRAQSVGVAGTDLTQTMVLANNLRAGLRAVRLVLP